MSQGLLRFTKESIRGNSWKQPASLAAVTALGLTALFAQPTNEATKGCERSNVVSFQGAQLDADFILSVQNIQNYMYETAVSVHGQ